MGITLEFLRYHWGDAYAISRQDGKWTAVARFGDHDVLTADSAEELRGMMWRHYPDLRAEGCST